MKPNMMTDNTAPVRKNRVQDDVAQSRVNCSLCPHNCRLAEGQTGLCKVRINRSGTVVPVSYGCISALALDPIEKKPLYHFHPGSKILSVGGFGCNMRCPFCQNYEIADADGVAGERLGQMSSAEELVAPARKYQVHGNIGIAFTYNEPLVALEFVEETFSLAKSAGLATVLVTNGCFNRETITRIAPLTDAWSIDLKAFNAESYRQLGGDLQTVKDTITLAARSAHVEVVTLLAPHFYDELSELEQLAAWLSSVSPDIPLHLTRFFPRYHLSESEPTSRSFLEKAKNVAQKYLHHVYLGNC